MFFHTIKIVSFAFLGKFRISSSALFSLFPTGLSQVHMLIHQTLSTAVFPTPHREREWEKSQHLLINISPFLKR